MAKGRILDESFMLKLWRRRRSLVRGSAAQEEFPDATFKEMCFLIGGEHSTKGDAEVCYIRRGPQSGTALIFYPSSKLLRVVSMGIGPYVPRAEEGTIKDEEYVFDTEGVFHCFANYTLYPQHTVGRFVEVPESYWVDCFSGELRITSGYSLGKATIKVYRSGTLLREYRFHGKEYAEKIRDRGREVFKHHLDSFTKTTIDEEGFEVIE